MRARIALLALLLVLLAGFVGYPRYAAYLRAVALKQTHAQVMAHNRAKLRSLQLQEEDRRQNHDLAEGFIPAAYPRPGSDWLERDKQTYRKLLGAGPYEVLVAPLKIGGWGFDRATRAVMTAQLALAIQRASGSTVADPFVVARALGDGVRGYDPQDLYSIADSIGAKGIVSGSVGHDQQGKLTIRLQSEERTFAVGARNHWGKHIRSGILRDIPFDDQHPVVDVFSAQLPQLLRTLGFAAALPVQVAAAPLSLTRLPESPRELLRSQSDPVLSAYTFTLLALLTPAQTERAAEHFAAKLFVTTSELPSTTPEYKALRARSYMLLGYRLAALRALDSPSSIEEREIYATLNGDLPKVRELIERESNPVKRLIAVIDANRIAADYCLACNADPRVDAIALQLPGTIWPYLVNRALNDAEEWAQFDNRKLKLALDHEFPQPGSTLQDIVRGGAALGDVARLATSVSLSVINHVQRYLADSAGSANLRLSTSVVQPGELDYLQLLGAIGDDNVLRHIAFLNDTQGLPDEALTEARAVESVYQGNPHFALVRAHAEYRAAQRVAGVERDSLLRTAYADAFNAAYWEQAQSRISSDALTLVSQIGRHPYGYFDNFYCNDIPYHPLYMIWGGGGDPATIRANGLAALSNATSQFDAVNALLGYDWLKRAYPQLPEQLSRLIEGRFAGDPWRAMFLANLQLSQGNADGAAVLLRQTIEKIPSFGPGYLALGKIAIAAGRPEEAAKAFLADPGLRSSSSASSVEIAHRAFEMGSYFYSSGDYALATPLYQIAAAQQSGSAAELDAQMRLQLLSGNLPQAAALALARGQRYGNERAYGDYLSILHAANHSDAAWAAFNTLMGRASTAALWRSALVGHHRHGDAEDVVISWLRRSGFATAGNEVSYGANFLGQFSTTDRIPSQRLIDTIVELDRPVWQLETGARAVVRPDADGRLQHILGPLGVTEIHGVLPIGTFAASKKHRVRSPLYYFVAGDRAIKLGEFSQAKALFDEAATLYDMSSSGASYLLPYYVLATVRAGGDSANVAQILSRFSPEQQTFDYQLARAALLARTGKPEQILAALRLARYRRTTEDDRPTMTEFTYADMCEELYKATHAGALRAEALDWARASERAEPWQAWSYTLEAVLTSDAQDRKRAIAMGQYLDPQSAHLSTLPKAEIDEAVRQFGPMNAFLPRSHAVGESAAPDHAI